MRYLVLTLITKCLVSLPYNYFFISSLYNTRKRLPKWCHQNVPFRKVKLQHCTSDLELLFQHFLTEKKERRINTKPYNNDSLVSASFFLLTSFYHVHKSKRSKNGETPTSEDLFGKRFAPLSYSRVELITNSNKDENKYEISIFARHSCTANSAVKGFFYKRRLLNEYLILTRIEVSKQEELSNIVGYLARPQTWLPTLTWALSSLFYLRLE